jgi:hypothetical protein
MIDTKKRGYNRRKRRRKDKKNRSRKLRSKENRGQVLVILKYLDGGPLP